MATRAFLNRFANSRKCRAEIEDRLTASYSRSLLLLVMSQYCLIHGFFVPRTINTNYLLTSGCLNFFSFSHSLYSRIILSKSAFAIEPVDEEIALRRQSTCAPKKFTRTSSEINVQLITRSKTILGAKTALARTKERAVP